MVQSHENAEIVEQPGLLEREPEFQASFFDLLITLAARKFFILKFVGVAALLALAVCLVWPKSYTATTKIMPPQQSQSGAAAMLGQLSPLAAIAGKDLGVRNVGDVYLYILRSRTVGEDLTDHFSLMTVYREGKRVAAIEELRANTQMNSGPEGGISISVTDRDPRRAADLANAYVEELKKLTKTLAVTEAGQRVLFFEQQVKKAEDDLAQAEIAMKQTQERTGIIQLDSQSKAMIEALTTMHAQIGAKEAQVEAMRSFATPENPDLVRAQSELAALRRELTKMEAGKGGTSLADFNLRKVPDSALEYIRRLRELKYREALLEVLTKQYEVARIDEAKDSAIIQVLDKAVPPEERSSPKRALVVSSTSILALLFAILFAVLTERAKEDPELSAQINLIKQRLFTLAK